MTFDQRDKVYGLTDAAESLAKAVGSLVSSGLREIAVPTAATLRQTADQILRILENPENETTQS